MTTLPFRLVKLGLPENPVKVGYFHVEDGKVVFSDENMTVPLDGVENLEDVVASDLPSWMVRAIPETPITILPVQTVTGDTLEEAFELLIEAIDAAYDRSVEHANFSIAKAS